MGAWGQVWVLLAHPVTSFHGDGAVGSGLGMQLVPQQGGRWGRCPRPGKGLGMHGALQDHAASVRAPRAKHRALPAQPRRRLNARNK